MRGQTRGKSVVVTGDKKERTSEEEIQCGSEYPAVNE